MASADVLRELMLERAAQHGMELDESAIQALTLTFHTLTKDALDRAVAHLRPPRALGSMQGACHAPSQCAAQRTSQKLTLSAPSA